MRTFAGAWIAVLAVASSAEAQIYTEPTPLPPLWTSNNVGLQVLSVNMISPIPSGTRVTVTLTNNRGMATIDFRPTITEPSGYYLYPTPLSYTGSALMLKLLTAKRNYPDVYGWVPVDGLYKNGTTSYLAQGITQVALTVAAPPAPYSRDSAKGAITGITMGDYGSAVARLADPGTTTLQPRSRYYGQIRMRRHEHYTDSNGNLRYDNGEPLSGEKLEDGRLLRTMRSVDGPNYGAMTGSNAELLTDYVLADLDFFIFHEEVFISGFDSFVIYGNTWWE